MVIAAVEDGDLDGEIFETGGSMDSGEAAADDDNTRRAAAATAGFAPPNLKLGFRIETLNEIGHFTPSKFKMLFRAEKKQILAW